MKRIAFTIPGKPFAKQRPRFSRASGRTYTPAETVSFERTVGQIAMQHFPAPLSGPVRVEVIATFAPAKSLSRVKALALMGKGHTSRPDADNLGKAICDGLNRIAFADDAQIAEISIRKAWGPNDQTTIFVEAAE